MPNVLAPGSLLYRCRLCGLVYPSAHAPSALNALLDICRDGSTPKDQGIVAYPTTVHHCQPGRLGVADLIGAEMDP
jgi:hypothetical protein